MDNSREMKELVAALANSVINTSAKLGFTCGVLAGVVTVIFVKKMLYDNQSKNKEEA